MKKHRNAKILHFGFSVTKRVKTCFKKKTAVMVEKFSKIGKSNHWKTLKKKFFIQIGTEIYNAAFFSNSIEPSKENKYNCTTVSQKSEGRKNMAEFLKG